MLCDGVCSQHKACAYNIAAKNISACGHGVMPLNYQHRCDGQSTAWNVMGAALLVGPLCSEHPCTAAGKKLSNKCQGIKWRIVSRQQGQQGKQLSRTTAGGSRFSCTIPFSVVVFFCRFG